MEIILRRFGIGHALGSVDPKALFPDKGINVDQPDHVVKMIMGEQQMHRIISIQNFPVFTEIRHSGSRIQYEKFPRFSTMIQLVSLVPGIHPAEPRM